MTNEIRSIGWHPLFINYHIIVSRGLKQKIGMAIYQVQKQSFIININICEY